MTIMGRTYRKRNSKKGRNYSIENMTEVIALNKWIKTYGFQKCKKIKLAKCMDTERGIMAAENIESGDTIMEIPFELILSMNTLDSDEKFKQLFLNTQNSSFQSQTCQNLLSFYLSYLKISKLETFWTSYIKTIPNSFTIPYFFPAEFLKYSDQAIQNIVTQQNLTISSAFLAFKNLLNLQSKMFLEIDVENFNEGFTLELFTWAYFAINSRCVYLDPDIVVRAAKNNNQFYRNIISDPPNLGLIPFLDMFNHSPNASTDAKLVLPGNVLCKNEDYTSVDHEKPIFRLISLTSYSHYDELFICYGQHGNLKLLTEYGFCLPFNPFSGIEFSFENICNIIKKNNSSYSISKEKYAYICKHSLNKGIFVDYNGLSYNFLRLLLIITNDDKRNWDKQVYSPVYCDADSIALNKLIIPILLHRRNILFNTIECFHLVEEGEIFQHCQILYKENINIIENVLKSLK